MKGRWSKKDRKMMQKIVNYYKNMLRENNEMEFNRKEGERICGFCEAAKALKTEPSCECNYCRIPKCFGIRCNEAFPMWWQFYDNGRLPFKKRKALLRSAITFELEYWGVEMKGDKIVAIKDMAAGNEMVGEAWKETKIFSKFDTLENVMNWVNDKSKNVTLTILNEQTNEEIRKAIQFHFTKDCNG